MRFLLYLQNQRHFSPQDILLIRSKLSRHTAKSGVTNYDIKNIRVSRDEVQLDVFIADNAPRKVQEEIVNKIGRHLERNIGPVKETINLSDGLTTRLNESAIIQKVVQTFNSERYWEAQETAEAVWNKTKNPDEKDVVQGVILVGAALVHHQRNEDEVCLSILERAAKKLEAFARVQLDRRSFLSIDIKLLKENVQKILTERKPSDIRVKHI